MIAKEVIAKMPKIELHCHLDGSLSIGLIRKFLRESGTDIAISNEEFMKRISVAKDGADTLGEYLDYFYLPLSLLQTSENLELASYDVIRQASEDNVKYMELRFAPMLHLSKGLDMYDAVNAVIEGIKRAEEEFDIMVGIVICGLRNESPEKLEDMLDIFINIGNCDAYLVGCDLVGDEEGFPPAIFEGLIEKLHLLSIPMTMHAGEIDCPQNIISSIELGAKRIAGAMAVKDILDKIPYFKDRGIVFELSPTSDSHASIIKNRDDYSFKKLYDAGVFVTINTDNRTVSNTTLNKEYEKISSWYDFDLDDFEKINNDAIDASFISIMDKKRLKKAFSKEYEDLRKIA